MRSALNGGAVGGFALSVGSSGRGGRSKQERVTVSPRQRRLRPHIPAPGPRHRGRVGCQRTDDGDRETRGRSAHRASDVRRSTAAGAERPLPLSRHSCIRPVSEHCGILVIDNAIHARVTITQPNDRARADEPNVERALDRTLSTEVTPCPARAAPPYLTSWAECLA